MPHASTVASSELDALAWRCIGPSRGGRVVAVAGDAADPMTAYFGACAGGVWKTTDGGTYWRCVTDGFLNTAAIGALAVSRSDPNVVYAGTGETTIRLDVSYGDGIYKSSDAGRTWRHAGLGGTKHIGRISIHPHNPDIAYVAALGEIFGPNEERGVFRTQDGGRTWENVLSRGPDAGCVDLSLDPGNPRIVFAAFWQARRNFWNLSSGGPGSGLFRSTDGGDSWEDISGHPGLPKGMLGKLGVSVSPAQAGRVWALIEAMDDQTGLYRSDDAGASWRLVSSSRDLMHRPWYYTHVFADPCHAETVYVTNLQMWKSTDGGASFSEVMTPHGDNHDVWIDPVNPRRLVQGNDGGACVSYNGGETWSSVYNQLTAQFYRIATDDQYPYRVYGTQQDNTAISVPSASVWGAITLGDCTYPGSGESGFIAPHPDDANVVFCGAIGSSPGGAGALQRHDLRTGQIQLVNVWPEESTGVAPKDLKYRFAWTFPILFSPHDSGTLYAGGNRVFRTRDQGMRWEAISPDLSLNDPSRQGHSGGEITRESAGAEVHATCACLAESAHRPGEIWATTDDGLVHVTRDGGGSWTDVTPPTMPALAYVGCVELSAHDADTVYLAATCYKLGDYRPYLFRSRDGGASWEQANGDFPPGEITRVVRADPAQPGLLFAGTETGLFFSLDDGGRWQRFGGGLPVSPVYDVKIKGSDLVVGTHGRSFWILDDITPLRALAGGGAAAGAAGLGARLFAPRETVRTKLHFGALKGAQAGTTFGVTFGIGGGIHTTEGPDGRKRRTFLDVGENPPNGAILYYWLDEAGPATITVRDAAGGLAARFGPDAAAGRRPPGERGLNRFVWDLRHEGAEAMEPEAGAADATALARAPERAAGPMAVPGDYTVTLEAGGARLVAPVRIVKDPRLGTTDADYGRQFALLARLHGSLSTLNQSVNRIRRLKRQLAALLERVEGTPGELAQKARLAAERLGAVEEVLVDVKRASPRDVLRHPAGLNDTLADMIAAASMSDTAPTESTAAVSEEVMGQVDAAVARIEALAAGELSEINRLSAQGTPNLIVDRGGVP